MFKAPESPYLVPFDGSFNRSDVPTLPPKNTGGKKELKDKLKDSTNRLDELQRIFNAHDTHAMLLIFQGIDAAGKDSTVRAVFDGVNPAGCQVYSFKQPSTEDLDHDFLWRTSRCLPERGRIGVFNRSYYEEVLIVKVHPEYLDYQKLPADVNRHRLWEHRYESIRNHEKHLAHNGMVILKFWLNISKDEQKRRFLSRLEEPEKNWKFSTSDMEEREHWDDYMEAFESAVGETSQPWAPWYAIPGDSKPYMRYCVADIIVRAMESLDLHYPKVEVSEHVHFDELRKTLLEE